MRASAMKALYGGSTRRSSTTTATEAAAHATTNQSTARTTLPSQDMRRAMFLARGRSLALRY